jgi:hypothetical protein
MSPEPFHVEGLPDQGARPIRDCLTASGGICAPMAPFYDLNSVSSLPAPAPTRRQRFRYWWSKVRWDLGHWVAGTKCGDDWWDE